MSRNKPIFIDIETGGIDPTQSSILSIASGESGKVKTNFNYPPVGTFLSRFSEENILPQLQAARSSGQSLISERAGIESLISQLQKNPTSPLSGYNIRGFDLGFVQRRARNYGLESSFTRALGKREIIDPVNQVKDIVASAISQHADAGTFSSQLGGLSWDQAHEKFKDVRFRQRPVEYNLIAQVKGYLHAGDHSAMFKGWKLEDMHKILESQGAVSSVGGVAHEAATDIKMTENVLSAARSGKMAEAFAAPAAATQWMDIVKNRGYHQLGRVVDGVATGGRILSQADIQNLGLGKRSLADRLKIISKNPWARAAAVGAASVWALNKISSKDDDYNTIEGLGHGGMAQQGRLHLTEFGSGWRGIIKLGAGTRALMDSAGQPAVGFMANPRMMEKTFQKYLSHLSNPEIKESAIAGLVGQMGTREKAVSEFDTLFSDLTRVHRETQDAIKAGHTGTIYIGVQKGETTGKQLKALIKHERVHVGSHYTNGGKHVEGETPQVFHDYLKAKNYNAGNEKSYHEEFVAFSHQANVSGLGSNPFLVFVNPTNKNYANAVGHGLNHKAEMDVAAAYGAELERVGQLHRLEKIHAAKGRVRPVMSYKDDKSNTVEGLAHGGWAQKLRKFFTPFGSGWDGLRNLVQGTETFQKMISSRGFQKSLSEATVVKQLGKGAMGEANLMSGSFRGQPFSFVRKTGQMSENEPEAMRVFQDKFGPTLYGTSSTHLDMELFQGETVKSMFEAGKLTPEHMQGIRNTVKEFGDAGYMHGDYHWNNMMITKEGKVGAIDFGAAGPIGSSGTVELTNGDEIMYTGFRERVKEVTGKWQREPIDIRSAEFDTGRLKMLEEKVGSSISASPVIPEPHKTRVIPDESDLFSKPLSDTIPDSMRFGSTQAQQITKKARIASLNRSASATTWRAGKNGGRRSKT